MTARKLVEQGTLLEAKGSEGVFPIKIIREGKGSSGTYTAELLESFADVFANRPMHMNHPRNPDAPWERDVLGIAARTSEVRVGKDEDGKTALYTDAKVRKEYREFVEEFGDLIGVSIYASGTGTEVDGEYVVESFDGSDAYTSIDFVVAAGAGGRVERMLESYRQIETSAGVPADDGSSTEVQPQIHSEGNEMDISELAAKVDVLQESINALAESHVALAEALKPVAVEPAETDLAAVVEAAVEAGLPKESRDVVVESVKAGVSVEDAISRQKALVESVRKSVEQSYDAAGAQGRVVVTSESATSLIDLAGIKVGA